MKRLICILIAFLMFVAIGACNFTVEGDPGVRSTDKEYMALLMKELDSAGIGYRIDREGFIRYSSRDKERVKKIEASVHETLFKLSPGSGGRIRSTDPEYMRLLKKELDSAGIKYEVDKEGFVVYSKADKQQFQNIDAKIHKVLYEGIRIRLNDKSKRERVVSLLKKEGIEYTLLNRKDGVWVKWIPKDEKHKEEIWSKLREITCPKNEIRKTKDQMNSNHSTSSQMILKKGAAHSCAS